MALFPNEYSSDMVIVKDIDFNSVCEHHWLPFSGKVTVAYIPNESVIGLSKIPRVVKYFSKQPTLQEKLTKDIADYLNKHIKPYMIYVMAKSTHSCVKCRGAESDCETVTTYSVFNSSLDKDSALLIREQIDKNFGVAGLFMPWLCVALFTNTFDIMLVCYVAYYILSFLAICVLYCKRATAFESEAQSKMKKINKE